MTAEQHAALDRARTRISRLQPDVIAAVIVAFRQIASALGEAELVRLIAAGAIDRILTVLLADVVLDRATLPLRLALRQTVEKAFRWNVPYLPKGGKVNGHVAVMFDTLNPRVVEALSSFENTVVSGLKDGVRESVQQALTRGLETRQSNAALARSVRAVVGLSPRQEAAVANFRSMLERGDRTALSRELRDRRFDATLDRLLGAEGKGLTEAQIEKMTDAYRRQSTAANAETISRAATQSAYKLAQRQSWESAIARGIVPSGIVRKRWLHLDGQENPRPHHEAMQGETVPLEAPYSNGDTFAGEHDPWNCHCIDIYQVA